MSRTSYHAQRRVALLVGDDPVRVVAAAYRRGATIPALAKQYGVATGTIWYWLRRAGVPRKLYRRRRIRIIDDDAAARLIGAIVRRARRDAARDRRAAAWLQEVLWSR